MNVVVADATPTGKETARLLLEGVPDVVTLRELIRHRVREEVARHNAAPGQRFNGLVQPTSAERDLNGTKRRHVDWEAQASAALEAFGRNGFVVFAGGRQLEGLDDPLDLHDLDVVSFVRLIPLVGG